MAPRVRSNRYDFVLDEVQGRSVLHVGCLDSPFTAEAIDAGRWLHENIRRRAERVVGVDIDEEGLEVAQRRGLGDDIVLADLSESEPLPHDIELSHWDVIVATEVVEHVGNLEAFLRGIRRVASADSRLLITTPNSFSLRHTAHVALKSEFVHPDHRYYFSDHTIRRALDASGWGVTELSYYRSSPDSPRKVRVFDSVISRLRPQLLPGLCVVAVAR